MITELEELFYKTFGIEKIECCKHFKYFDSKCDRLDSTEKCLDCIGTNKVYPKITDRKLLEMICVLSQWDADNYYQILANNMQDLKNEILNDCINFKQKLKNKYFDAQIQQLFKGEE